MMRKFFNDECGAVISAELVLILTIVVLSLVVGLSELAHGIVQELNDVGDALGNLNQSYYFGGFAASKTFGSGFKAFTVGSEFTDVIDECDNNQCAITCNPSAPETPKT